MDVAQRQGSDSKHPVLASVLMGILRALDEDSTGKSSSSSSSDDHVICGLHDRREPPCRRRLHEKSSKAEAKPAEEHVLPSDEELLSPKQDYPIPDFIRTPPGSPNLHTILETEEECEEIEEEQDGSLIVEKNGQEEKMDQHRENDSVQQLQKEIKPCSSTSSPLVTSDDSDVAAFLSKHEYATLFGPESNNKILIPSRFVQDHGEVLSYTKTGERSPLKRGSDFNLERAQIKKQKAEIKPLKTPPQIAKRKLESLLGDAIEEFTQSIEESSIDTRGASGQQAIGSDRETLGKVSGDLSYESSETASFIGRSDVDSPSQRKRLKTSEESELSSEETSDTLSDDTVEESAASSFYDERRLDTTGKHKKKIKRSLRSLRIDTPSDGMSDVSSDGQMGTLRPSMMGKIPGAKVGLGGYGLNLGTRNDVKNMLQKAVSISLDEFSDMLSPDLHFSTGQSDALGKTDTADSGSVRVVSESRKVSESDRTQSTVEEFGHVEPSAQSGSTMPSDLGTIETSSRKSSVNVSQTSQLENELEQEYISQTASMMSSHYGKIQTPSEKLGANTGGSSEPRMDLQIVSSSRSESNISSHSGTTKSITPTGQSSEVSPTGQSFEIGSELQEETISESESKMSSDFVKLQTSSEKSGANTERSSEPRMDSQMKSSSRSVSNASSNLGTLSPTGHSSEVSLTGQSFEIGSELQEETISETESKMSSDFVKLQTSEKSGANTERSSEPRMDSQMKSSSRSVSNASSNLGTISHTGQSSEVSPTGQSSEIGSDLLEETISESISTTSSNLESFPTSQKSGYDTAHSSDRRRELQGSAVSSTMTSRTTEQDFESISSSEEEFGVETALSDEIKFELQHTNMGSKMASETNEDLKSTLTSIGSTGEFTTSSESEELTLGLDMPSSSSSTLESGMSSSKRSGIDPRDLPAVLRTGSSQPIINPLVDFYSSLVSSDGNASSNASTHFNQSGKSEGTSRSQNSFVPSSDVYSTSIASSAESKTAATSGVTFTPTGSADEHGWYGSYQSGKTESESHSSDYTGEYTHTSSSNKSITKSIHSRTGKEIFTTDSSDKSSKLLSNINLTEALLRSDPSPTDYKDSDSVTTSSDEYIIDRLARDTPTILHESFTKTTFRSDVGEDRDFTSGENMTDGLEEHVEDTLDSDIDKIEVLEEPVRDYMKIDVLPVLLEDEKSSEDISKEAEDEDSDSISDVQSREETMQETSSLTTGNESSTLYGDIPSSDERLFMIDLDKNGMVFEDTLITNDTSVSSVESERLPMYEPELSSSETSPEIQIEPLRAKDEFDLVVFANDITQFVMLNAVARVFADILVNVAIRRLTDEQDFSLQMELALFPGIQEERREKPVPMHWISPPRYCLARYDRPLAKDNTGLSDPELQEQSQSKIRDEGEEALMICLERAFFPCLAGVDNTPDDDNIHTRRQPVPPEEPRHLLPEASMKTDRNKMVKNPKACKLTGLITAASRVSIFAAETISQMWSIMTSVSWTVWSFLRENLDVKKVKRKDESTQCDGGSDNDTSHGDDMTEWIKRDEVKLHVLASKVVASAVTNAVWGKQYAVLPASASLETTIKSDSRSDTSIPTPTQDIFLSRQKSKEDYQLQLSASSVVEQVVANAVRIYDSTCIDDYPATSHEVSSQSLSSGRDSQNDEDSVSACSLSDIPLSSITFMRQQLADMREIFQSAIPGIKSEVNSPTSIAAVSQGDVNPLRSSSIPQTSSANPFKSQKETTPVSDFESFPDEGKEENRVTEGSEIMNGIIGINGVGEKILRKQSSEGEDSSTHRETDDHDDNENVVEDATRGLESIPSEGEKFVQEKNEPELRKIGSSPDAEKDEINEQDRDEETMETQNESGALLSNTSKSEEQFAENVNASDLQGDSSSTSSSALSLSDVPFSGISYIREQLANVKILANSIMDDFNSYAEDRSLVSKRSSQLTARSQSSCDTSCTIKNGLSVSSSSFNVHGQLKLNENKNSHSDQENGINLSDQKKDGEKDDILENSIEGFSRASGALERPNENGNAKTHKDNGGTENINESKHEKKNPTEESEKQESLEKPFIEHSIKVRRADRNRCIQRKEEHRTKEIATFSRNSPGRLNVIPRKKSAGHPHGMYSGESSCSTDYSSSVMSRPSSSFSDGSVSSESRKVTVESESQGKGRTDVSCRISDRGIWVNTAFVNAIDGDNIGASTGGDDHESTRDNIVKNKIMINVKMSPSSRKKHHSHRVRSRVRDTRMLLAPEDKQSPLAIPDNEVLTQKHGDMITQESKQVYEEVNVMSETKSLKSETTDSRIVDRQLSNVIVEGRECQSQALPYEQNDGNKYQAEHLVKRLTPKKERSSESRGLEKSRKTDGYCTSDSKQIMRECLSDGAVTKHHQIFSRRQSSLKKKSRETKPSDSPCPSCAEKSRHLGDLLAAPVISRSERTRAVLSMLDDVAENLSLDTSEHDDTGTMESIERSKTIERMGSFRKLFASKKNKRRKGSTTPGQNSPRVISDSSFTESDGESPECSSDSSHASRSNSSASLLSSVLRNLSLKRRKKKPKGLSSSTPKSTKPKKGSVTAFDEMLADLEGDFFIDDSFPKLVSTRDSSPSDDNTSLNEVLQDLIEEWSFDGLQESLDSYPQSMRERIRGKLQTFMNEVRKEKHRAQLLLRRATTL